MKTVLVLIISLTLTNSLYATNAEMQAERLLESLSMEMAFKGVIAEKLDFALANKPEMQRMRPIFEEYFEKYMSFQSLKPELIAMYTQAFTADELKIIADFYGTKAGQKSRELIPELIQKSSELAAQRIEENREELVDRIVDEKIRESERDESGNY
ncbi:MAG: DUF2059 domain-containing protein [Gammaproteobacteria bacterium]|nr:DUF2059 domain-containing protein [Gammaproteobacteria bacterium]